jgi:hypothetical protein
MGCVAEQRPQPRMIAARRGLRRETVHEPLQMSAPTARGNSRKRHLSDPAASELRGRVTKI